MPRANGRRRKRTLSRKPNMTTIPINATDTVAFYGLQPFGARGIGTSSSSSKWSDVVTNPRAYRKEDDEISR